LDLKFNYKFGNPDINYYIQVMITTIITLSILLLIAIAAIIYCMRHIAFINDELDAISEEQHDMTNNIIEIYTSLNKIQNFQIDQHNFNKEVASGFQQIADRELIRQLQDIDPTKIGRA